MTNPRIVALIVALQAICGLVFIWEIAISLLGLKVNPINWQLYEFIEIGAALGLLFGVVMGAIILRRSWQRQAEVTAQLRVASGAFMDVVRERFGEWGFTPAEADVAMFSLKGFSLAEIAAFRETSEGTVKAQTNAIYRKAGVSGRAQLLSLFIEDLIAAAPRDDDGSVDAAG